MVKEICEYCSHQGKVLFHALRIFFFIYICHTKEVFKFSDGWKGDTVKHVTQLYNIGVFRIFVVLTVRRIYISDVVVLHEVIYQAIYFIRLFIFLIFSLNCSSCLVSRLICNWNLLIYVDLTFDRSAYKSRTEWLLSLRGFIVTEYISCAWAIWKDYRGKVLFPKVIEKILEVHNCNNLF